MSIIETIQASLGRTIRKTAVLAVIAVLLTPLSAQAGRWTAGPYQPAPAASYPSTPPIDASKPAIELAPFRERIRQTPEEGPIDPLDDSETPAGPTGEARQPSKQDGVPQGEARQPLDPANVPAGATEEAPAAVAERADEEVVEGDAGEVAAKIVREEGPRESVPAVEHAEPASATPSLGGGCSLVRAQ